MKKITEARKTGAKVEGYYVTCPTEMALERNRNRAQGEKDKGRLVSDEVVKHTHKMVSRILPQVARYFDYVQLYDTSEGGTSVLIAHGGDGKDLEVVDQKKFDAFLKKGNE